MGGVENFVKSGEWEQVVQILEEKWQTEEPGSSDSFFRALAAFDAKDYYTAYQYGLHSFELDGDCAEVSEFLAVLCVLAGKTKESYFYRKNLSILEPNQELQKIIPFGFIPDYTSALDNITETPLLQKAESHVNRLEWDIAEFWFSQHLAFEPNDRDAYLALARCLMRQERFRAASESLKSCAALFPKDTEIATMQGYLMTELGQFSEARAIYKWAMELAPYDEQVFANYIKDMQANPNISEQQLMSEMEDWIEKHITEIKSAIEPRVHGPRDVYNVGIIVSGVDRTRVAPMIGDIFTQRDLSKFYVTAYGEGDITYPFNTYFKAAVDEWRDVAHADSVTLRNMIVADGVDILIDFGGLQSIESLKCFGSRLAPVQISWSGSVLSGALPQYDYVVAEQLPEQYADKKATCEISNIFSAKREALDKQEERTDNTATFIADVTLSELTFDTVSTFAKVLLAKPEAMLVLRSHDFYAEDNSRLLIERFGLYGVAHRVDVIQESDRRAFFNNGDVALMPNGGNEPEVVLDAMTAGVPILGKMADRNSLCKGSTALVCDLGYSQEMLYSTTDDFVAGACRWMDDFEKRSQLSDEMNNRLEQSEYLNPQKRMEDIANMLEGLWQNSK
ncbi:CDC27 family protein [Terasakiella sp. SH-1]|uniref:CDC27 family protein n=1 Tax=Terasakiella sp. SH-1 TaxID=2560057 RepID=UPI00143213AE|nr:CDC27 family protein [Terasakiella sp. SH-1]